MSEWIGPLTGEIGMFARKTGPGRCLLVASKHKFISVCTVCLRINRPDTAALQHYISTIMQQQWHTGMQWEGSLQNLYMCRVGRMPSNQTRGAALGTGNTSLRDVVSRNIV